MDDEYTLEPDMIDRNGNRYVEYEAYELAQRALVDDTVGQDEIPE